MKWGGLPVWSEEIWKKVPHEKTLKKILYAIIKN